MARKINLTPASGGDAVLGKTRNLVTMDQRNYASPQGSGAPVPLKAEVDDLLRRKRKAREHKACYPCKPNYCCERNHGFEPMARIGGVLGLTRACLLTSAQADRGR